jgi:hypothetical protein
VARAVSPSPDRRAYWRAVEDCLVELYGMSRSEAEAGVAELRARLKTLPQGMNSGFIYHQEPIHQAADLVGQDLSPETYGRKYDKILERHNPVLRGRNLTESTSA